MIYLLLLCTLAGMLLLIVLTALLVLKNVVAVVTINIVEDASGTTATYSGSINLGDQTHIPADSDNALAAQIDAPNGFAIMGSAQSQHMYYITQSALVWGTGNGAPEVAADTYSGDVRIYHYLAIITFCNRICNSCSASTSCTNVYMYRKTIFPTPSCLEVRNGMTSRSPSSTSRQVLRRTLTLWQVVVVTRSK